MTLPQILAVMSEPEDLERAWRTYRMSPEARKKARAIKAIYDTY